MRAAIVPVILAIANALVWAAMTPSFQVPDEIVHVGYVQYLGETGRIPNRLRTGVGDFSGLSQEERTAVDGVPFTYQAVPTWLHSRDRAVRVALDRPLNRVSEAGAGSAANNPPLYYAFEALPYRVFHGASFYDRLFAMRAFSALLAGLTTLFVFLFLRETLPGTPWTWTVGALVVAFQPLLGFVSGGVNPDALLWGACAALFWLLARALRRGLTPRLGIAIGAALAAGLLTKGAMLGMVPGAAIALGLAAWRAPPERRRTALVGAGAALAVAALPYGIWLLASSGLSGSVGGGATSGASPLAPKAGIAAELGYVWQVYLPRLPFMNDQFQTYPAYPLWDSYFQGFVGRFGYFEFGFRTWVSWVVLAFAVPVTLLALRFIWQRRAVVLARWPEIVSYSALVLALALLLGLAGFRYRSDTGLAFEQARYLLPLLALWGLFVVIAARGAGRWARPLAGVFVVAAGLHSVLSMLVTLARYYG